MSDDLMQKITKVVVDKLGVTEDKVKPEAAFAEDLGADSLDQVELVMALEDEFARQDVDLERARLRGIGEIDRGRLLGGARHGEQRKGGEKGEKEGAEKSE